LRALRSVRILQQGKHYHFRWDITRDKGDEDDVVFCVERDPDTNKYTQ
jgi:hypothetical protein